MDRTFDRLPHFDARSRRYPIRAIVGGLPLRAHGWPLKTQLDQGREGACVGFAWSHELAAVPRVVPVTNGTALALYHRAQQLDDQPGEDYEGTSVLAGAKTVEEQGHLSKYRWAFGLNDMLLALGYQGPVVLGVNWREGMWDTDSKGYVHPTGEVVGGHAIVAIAVHTASKRVVLQNSWGAGWGLNGRCYVSWSDMDKLLADEGECCVPMVRV